MPSIMATSLCWRTHYARTNIARCNTGSKGSYLQHGKEDEQTFKHKAWLLGITKSFRFRKQSRGEKLCFKINVFSLHKEPSQIQNGNIIVVIHDYFSVKHFFVINFKSCSPAEWIVCRLCNFKKMENLLNIVGKFYLRFFSMIS